MTDNRYLCMMHDAKKEPSQNDLSLRFESKNNQHSVFFLYINLCYPLQGQSLCWTPNIGILSGPINGTVSSTASASDTVLTSPPARNMDCVLPYSGPEVTLFWWGRSCA